MPEIQLNNGTIFNMDTRKYIQNILKNKYKTIGPFIQFMGSWIQSLNNFGILKVG